MKILCVHVFLLISNIWAQTGSNKFKLVLFINNFWLTNFTVVIPIENSIVRNYWAKFLSQNYWLYIIDKLLSPWTFFGMEPICNLYL